MFVIGADRVIVQSENWPATLFAETSTVIAPVVGL